MPFDDGRDWTTRRLGSVKDAFAERLSVSWDPKSGGAVVRLEGDAVVDCDAYETTDDDGYCRDHQSFVANLEPEQAEALARLLTEAATASRVFFAKVPSGPLMEGVG